MISFRSIFSRLRDRASAAALVVVNRRLDDHRLSLDALVATTDRDRNLHITNNSSLSAIALGLLVHLSERGVVNLDDVEERTAQLMKGLPNLGRPEVQQAVSLIFAALRGNNNVAASAAPATQKSPQVH